MPLAPAVTAEPPARRDDPMAGHARRPTTFHDVSDRPRRARRPGRRRNVAVRRDTAGWNPPHGGKHALAKTTWR